LQVSLFEKKCEQGERRLPVRLILFALLLPLFWLMYRTMLVHVMQMFNEPLESMSHGWLIPFVSLYALWLQRRELQRTASTPSWTGGIFVLLALGVFWLGSRGGQSRIEQVSLIGLLWAVPFAFWGGGVARRLIFPVGFLVFTIPITSLLDIFTVTLRLLSTSVVCVLMNGIGYEIQRMGNTLFSRMPGAEFNLEVADGCSGIESFFAVMALTAAYAWLRQRTLLQKILLFSFAVPIAVIGNSVRLIGDCLVAVWFGQEAVGGYYHDYSGFAIAFFNVFLVVQAGRLVAALDGWVAGSRRIPQFLKEPAVAADGQRDAGALRTLTLPVAVTLLMAGFCVGRFYIPEPFYGDVDFIAADLPVRVMEFTGEVPWFCQKESCLRVESEAKLEPPPSAGDFRCPACGGPMSVKSLGETTDTPKDTVILKRNYRSGDGMAYSMNVVIGGRNRYSIHRAEQCLPAQGFLMEKTGTAALNLGGNRQLHVRKIDASRQGTNNATLIYWFVSKKRGCTSHVERILLDVWDRSVHNRINRWIMFSVFIPSGLSTPESVERFESFLTEFYPQVLLKENLDDD